MAGRKRLSPSPDLCAVLLLISTVLLGRPAVRGVQGRSRAGSSEAGAGNGDGGSRLRTYIVHVQQPVVAAAAFSGPEKRDAWYRSFLPVNAVAEEGGGAVGESRWVHSYHEVLSGFAAKLTEEEVAAMEKKEGFVHAYPDVVLPLATTHTPEFLGLHLGSGLWTAAPRGGGQGEGVIVGMLDTGYKSGHPSFDDQGMPPPPRRWKGSCSDPKYCNNKVIGAKTFIAGDDAPTDEVGHGTHTASTVAGSFVKNANVLGSANGTASGVAPRAHLAIYKVCGVDGCPTSSIVAGMDAAVADGVDVLSISLGGDPTEFFSDGIAIAAFGATKKGVLVSCSAGNNGPSRSMVVNDAPWILTVGASTIDRSIVAAVKLGDGSRHEGQSAFQPTNFTRQLLPLVYPRDKFSLFYCAAGSLDDVDVKGKVVVCDRGGHIAGVEKGANVLKAGGAAMIIVHGESRGNTTDAAAHVLPASHVPFADGAKIKDYIKSSPNPTASLSFEGTKLYSSSRPSPAVASFSSRGPSTINGGLIKPDVIGPGVNILAAWPDRVGPPTRRPKGGKPYFFNIISGTSMSAPHLSGVAALLKSAHPEWSPAAIKSAIITTTYVRGNDGEPIKDDSSDVATIFAMGAGHVNVTRAADPGLVYDLDTNDYIAYVCGLGFADNLVAAIVGQQDACSAVKAIPTEQLNYPSILVTMSKSSTATFNRTVTNVGEAGETYKAEVEAPEGLTVSVNPQTLMFSAAKEKQSFTVTVTKRDGAARLLEGSLRWVSAKHTVRSPIVAQ